MAGASRSLARPRRSGSTVAPSIRSQHAVAAPASVVHAVLTDVRAWRLWSPHIARVEAAEQVIDRAGWSGSVKPWFGPATQMTVSWCEPGRGIRWTSAAAGYRLDYADLIEPDGDGCTVTMTAQLHGPARGARRGGRRAAVGIRAAAAPGPAGCARGVHPPPGRRPRVTAG